LQYKNFTTDTQDSDDEMIEESKQQQQKKIEYIFLIDRSGSMY